MTTLAELEYCKATSNPVRMVLAVPTSRVAVAADLPDGVRISTEFPS